MLSISLVGCDQNPTSPSVSGIEDNSSGAGSAASTTDGLWLAPGRFPQASLKLASQSQTTAQPAEQGSSTSLPPIMDQQVSEVCQGVSFRDSAGVTRQGQKVCELIPCSATVSTNCQARTGFATIDRSQLSSSKMVNGYQLSGITGSYDESQFRYCSTSGQQNCTSGQGYIAVDKSLVAPSNIKVGTSVTPQLTGTYPSGVAPLSHSFSGTSQLPNGNINNAVRSNSKFHFWDSAGNPHQVTGDTNLNSANLYSTVSTYGVTGSVNLSDILSCKTDGASSCEVGPGFVAINTAQVTAGHIKRGVILGGITGSYPSAGHTLAVSTETADLTPTSLNSQIASDGRFEYFDHTGARYEQSGDSNLKPANILKDLQLFGITGSYNGVDYEAEDGYDFRFKVPVPTQAWGGLGLTLFCNDAESCSKIWPDLSSQVNSDNSSCNANSKTCIFRSKVTRIQWLFDVDGQPKTFDEARSFCETSTKLGKGDWRLGTQKEVMQAAINGIDIITPYNSYDGRTGDRVYWTATADHSINGSIRRITYTPKTQIFNSAEPDSATRLEVMCMRVLDPDEK